MPLLRRAYEGWRDLEETSGRDLLTLCGGIYIGHPAATVFADARRAAEIHGLPHEVLDAATIRERFPAMNPADHAFGLYEDNAGFVRPEEAISANIDDARRFGADLRFEEAARAWRTTSGGGVEVETDQGTYGADRLIDGQGNSVLARPISSTYA